MDMDVINGSVDNDNNHKGSVKVWTTALLRRLVIDLLIVSEDVSPRFVRLLCSTG